MKRISLSVAARSNHSPLYWTTPIEPPERTSTSNPAQAEYFCIVFPSPPFRHKWISAS